MDITENSAALTFELPCFSSNLQCVISHFTTCCTNVNVTNITGDITGSLMAYSYPTHTITLTGLNSDTTYNYCIVATNATNMMEVGEPVCSSFTTQKTITKTNEGNHILYIRRYFIVAVYVRTYVCTCAYMYIFHVITCTCTSLILHG